MLPPAWFLLSLVATGLLHWLLPGFRILTPPASYAGVLLLILGLLLLVQPARVFARRRTDIHPAGRPTSLVTDGWFRVSRNPMYLGMVLATLGVAVALGSATPLLVPPLLLAVLDRRFVGHEEHSLREAFGEAYEAYCRRVRRWV